MGSSAVGRRFASLGGGAATLLWASSIWAQVPLGSASGSADTTEPAPAPEPRPALEPAPGPAPVAPAPVAPAPERVQPTPPPPPLDPPPSGEAPSRPRFLKTREEMEQLRPNSTPRRRLDEEAPSRPAQPATKPGGLPKDFVLSASPWIDFSLTSFWMDERTDNFLNIGVQVGGYLIERIRLTGRLVAPLEEATDGNSEYDSEFSSGEHEHTDSRSVSVLYGATFGLILSNSKTFLFAPGLSLWRTDVNDYGTTAALSLPFEWTTHRRLRVGFELALGHSFGGEVHRTCRAFATRGSCAPDTIPRQGGTAVLLQYQMGWALSGL